MPCFRTVDRWDHDDDAAGAAVASAPTEHNVAELQDPKRVRRDLWDQEYDKGHVSMLLRHASWYCKTLLLYIETGGASVLIHCLTIAHATHGMPSY